jgi:peptide-methionine (S)-S-oxide reductase
MQKVLVLAAFSLLVCACKGPTAHTTGAPTAADPAASASTLTGAAARAHVGTAPGHAGHGTPLAAGDGHELAAFAAGCFWGVEDNFRQVPGVIATAVGFSGGHTDSPSYEDVCTHTTGHAETVLVEFDPKRITYGELVTVFFKNHDPTTKNRQGPDVGDQYRSAIFTFTDAQAAAARAAMKHEQAAFSRPIVTEITPMTRFWIAEDYHQQYDEKTGTHSCPMPKGLPDRTRGT